MSESGKQRPDSDYDAIFQEASEAIEQNKSEDDLLVEVDDGDDAGTSQEAGGGNPGVEQIQELEKTNKELQDRLLRQAADFENFRKRSRKEADDARHRAREESLKEILPVIDNLERALEAADADTASVESIVQGVNMVLRQFQTTMERLGAKGFASKGEVFDPNRHEAIAQVETDEVDPGVVFQEMQRGYFLGERLLRPALVSVAKAPASAGDGKAASDASEGDGQ